MPAGRATLIGFGAVLLWALLALLTVRAGPVPPFQLAALCFTIGGFVGLAWMLANGSGFRRLRGVRPAVWVVGITGIFGYHFAYFTALANAPAAQASLIAYLWPLLIVLLSGLLPGERLRPMHLAGAGAGLLGAALVLMQGDVSGTGSTLGYGAAGACALLWSGYSIASRRLGDAPTETVVVFCFGSAILAILAHLALETTVWPAGAGAWIAVAGLGLGPVGLAFYLWDVGVKNGDIQLLGTASYAAPLLSTLILVIAGEAEATLWLLASAILIAGGAAMAAGTSRRSAGSASSGPKSGSTDARSLP